MTETWKPRYAALADRIVNGTFKMQPGERVIYLVDPAECPELFDEVRAAVWNAGAIEQATIHAWSPKLGQLRTPGGKPLEPDVMRRERFAHLDLFNTADIFMWLPTSFWRRDSVSTWESEWILGRWRGRGLHYHWFPDAGTPPGHPVHLELQKIYERGILDLDYAANARRQRALVEAIRGRKLHVTSPDGTDITFTCPREGWYCINDGDASKEKSLRATTARDREEELPCGAVRLLIDENSANGVIGLHSAISGNNWNWNGFGLDLTAFGDDLDIVMKGGHITELRSKTHQKDVDAARAKLVGDWDRIGEVVFGTNPLLTTPAEARMPTYWAFGDGGFRFHFGINGESGGHFEGNLWINLFLMRTTVEIDGGDTIVRAGKLTL